MSLMSTPRDCYSKETGCLAGGQCDGKRSETWKQKGAWCDCGKTSLG